MIDEMRRELSELSAKMERGKKIDSMLAGLHAQEQELVRQEQSLRTALGKEEDDVERLKKTTATSILYSLLGKIDDKLSIEQQEAFAAKLKYDAAVRHLDDCRARVRELRRERDSLAGCAQQFDRVHSQLLELLRADTAYGERLCTLERQQGMTDRQLKELDEAIAAGNAALCQIDSVQSSLGSAESWGTWDLLGGGLISDMAKHTHLDDAQDAAEELQILLSRFHTELADVAVNPNFGAVNVDGFLRFADYFFDGLFADWSVLSRIHDSQESIQQVRQQVGDALGKLKRMRAAGAAEKSAIARQIAELMADA